MPAAITGTRKQRLLDLLAAGERLTDAADTLAMPLAEALAIVDDAIAEAAASEDGHAAHDD